MQKITHIRPYMCAWVMCAYTSGTLHIAHSSGWDSVFTNEGYTK